MFLKSCCGFIVNAAPRLALDGEDLVFFLLLDFGVDGGELVDGTTGDEGTDFTSSSFQKHQIKEEKIPNFDFLIGSD